jgi:hypothetical protein
MPNATVAFDVSKPADILRDLPAERSFDGVIALQQRREAGNFFFVQIASTLGGLDAGFVTQLPRDPVAHSIQVAQGDYDRLIVGDVNA